MIEIKKGLWIKNTDGEVYQIVDICECERCKERGFCEPKLSNGDYITNENALKHWIASSWNPKDLVDHPFNFQYTNWKGKFGNRSVDGDTTRIYWGKTEWHPEEQWLMEAIDLDKGEKRTFAMKDMSNICE